jgi:D-alanyl-D-alanine dipeptidase
MSGKIFSDHLVKLHDVAPNIVQDIRYATQNNFIGRPVNGYSANVAILERDTAQALARTQEKFNELGYGLIIYDGYRPRQAVEHFLEWGHDTTNILMKERFYPSFEDKMELFNGYISKKSKHTLGVAVDVSLINLSDGVELDMGTEFDFLGHLSHTNSPYISEEAKNNRGLLKNIMEAEGLINYEKEWWHYENAQIIKRFPEEYYYNALTVA